LQRRNWKLIVNIIFLKNKEKKATLYE